MLPSLFFYLFAMLTLIGSFCVILSRNPVYSVLWLIFTFFNASGLFMLIGAEFLSMMIIIVYVGAVAVLFLFVIMMLDIDFQNLKSRVFQHGFMGFIVMCLFLANIGIALFISMKEVRVISRSDYPIIAEITNTHAIGKILYTDFILHFQAAGILLLVAMVGSIALTLRHKNWVKRQNSSKQLDRNTDSAIELTKVGFNEGVSDIDY